MSFNPPLICPSMITRGEPEPSRLVPPRSTKVGAAPGLPEVCATLSPATAPERA